MQSVQFPGCLLLLLFFDFFEFRMLLSAFKLVFCVYFVDKTDNRKRRKSFVHEIVIYVGICFEVLLFEVQLDGGDLYVLGAVQADAHLFLEFIACSQERVYLYLAAA